MEDTPTRLVWITFIAVMDEDGMCQFASVANLAHRARVSIDEATHAATCLESDDPHSSDPEFDGRRIERVPGGWIVLNAEKYRKLVTRDVIRERTRERVAKHREKKRAAVDGNAPVTPCNAPKHLVTSGKRPVTPSGAGSETEAKAETTPPADGVSDAGLKFADWFKTLLPADAKQSSNWREQWAKCYDEMLRLDNRTRIQIFAVCTWARNDEFWAPNFQTPLKLRQRKAAGHPQYFDVFAERMKTPSANESASSRTARREEKQYANTPGLTPRYNPMTDDAPPQ